MVQETMIDDNRRKTLRALFPNLSDQELEAVYRAESAAKEPKYLDLKSAFDPDSTVEWAEVINDIVAFANTGGGVIVFGVNDDGSTANFDTSRIDTLDAADITNKREAHTGFQFADFEVVKIEHHGNQRAALLIGSTDVPIVFTRPGADVNVKGKQRPAFAKGTVYFRHGAKSEPATRDDLSAWIARTIEEARSNWVKGIRKVVESPPGHAITVVSTPPN
jgi:predicted HTH transcriptional regulator